MAVVLVTGMSGTGKSAALAELARRGHRVVDTDDGGYAVEVPSSDAGGSEQVWLEDRIQALLDRHEHGVLFVSGCVANQGRFSARFDAVVLLSAPAEVILERVATRSTNDFGKSAAQRERILHDLATIEPLLRAGATAEIDTRSPLDEVADTLERIADAPSANRRRSVLLRQLPDGDVLGALARERLAPPPRPALAQRHPGEARHQVELGRPHVAERHRVQLELAVDDPVVVGDQALRRDVVLVEAEPRGVDVERADGLARRKPLELGDADLDHEAPARLEVRGDVAEARDLLVLGRQVHDRVEDEVRDGERPLDARSWRSRRS